MPFLIGNSQIRAIAESRDIRLTSAKKDRLPEEPVTLSQLKPGGTTLIRLHEKRDTSSVEQLRSI